MEPLNAVTYFCADVLEAFEHLGYQGFWMGYFAARSAPMGRVGPAVVEATFFNFHADRVRRALPDAWAYAAPEAALRVRAEASAAALRRLLGARVAEELASVVTPVLRAAIERAAPAGKPLFAANRDVDAGDDSVASMWQACTTLREHRGDCHVALLTASGLSGLEALVLFSLSEELPGPLLRASRGWSEDEWSAAVDGLGRGRLIEEDGSLSRRGAALRTEIELRTDELAAQPYDALSPAAVESLLGHLEPAARAIEASGEIRFPNPMGLPALEG